MSEYKVVDDYDDVLYLVLKEDTPAFVAVIPHIFNTNILFIKESDKYLVRFPGGGLRDSETIKEAASREVLEEIGFNLDKDNLEFLIAYVVEDDINNGGKYIKIFFTYNMAHGWHRAKEEEIKKAFLFSGSEEVTTDMIFVDASFLPDGLVRLDVRQSLCFNREEVLKVSSFHMRALRKFMESF